MKVLGFIIHVALCAGLAWWLWRKQDAGLKKIYWPAWLAKMLAGLVVGWLYTHYYSVGDTFRYFSDGTLLADLALAHPGQYFDVMAGNDMPPGLKQQLGFHAPRALLMTKIVSVFCVFSFYNYWTMALYFSMISFACALFLVRQIKQFHPECAWPAVLAFLFFPSVVFWTSGLIKESLAMASLYLLAGLFLRLWHKASIGLHVVLCGLIALWLLWNLKYYVAAVFLPVAVASLIYRWITSVVVIKRAAVDHLLWLMIFIVLLAGVTLLRPNFYPGNFLRVIVSNYEAYQRISAPDDVIRYQDIRPEVGSILGHAPLALVSGLFRPFLWEAGNALQVLVATENLVVLVFFILALGRLRQIMQSPHRVLIFSIIVYVVLLCIFLSLSTPNFGTLSRYRVAYVPFFVFIILCQNRLVKYLNNRLAL